MRAPLERLLDVLCWITRPDGTFPLIGDDDGGRLLLLDDEPADRVRTTLSAGAALFTRADWAHVAGGPTAELVWLMGATGLRAFQALQPTPSTDLSRAFPNGGLYVARSGWDASASLLTMDAGPHGFLNGGHAHADALSIDLTVQGLPLFVDPGTYTYTFSREWRDRFRDTRAHNAATVDGRASAVAAGAFQWASRVTAQCDAWFDDGRVLLFSGVHDGFEHGGLTTRYRRTIVYLRPATWIVRDEIRAEGDHELSVHWQCHPSITARTLVSGAVQLQDDEGLRATMRTAEPAEWRVEEGWISAMHGVRERSTRLSAVRTDREVVCLTTMISAAPYEASITADRDAPHTRADVRLNSKSGVVLFGGGRLGTLETDAVVAWIELGSDSEPLTVTAASYSRLTFDGIASPTAVSRAGVHWALDEAVRT